MSQITGPATITGTPALVIILVLIIAVAVWLRLIGFPGILRWKLPES